VTLRLGGETDAFEVLAAVHSNGTKQDWPWLAYFHFIPVFVSDTVKGGGVLNVASGSSAASWNRSSSSTVSNEVRLELNCESTTLVGRDV
jgi:hypothetical protein